jgi:hypothetical protein
MQTSSTLLPSSFNSNIYVRREFISIKITELVMFRMNCETLDCTPDDIVYCDNLLKIEHLKFKDIIGMIDLEETDHYTYGATFPTDQRGISI